MTPMQEGSRSMSAISRTRGKLRRAAKVAKKAAAAVKAAAGRVRELRRRLAKLRAARAARRKPIVMYDAVTVSNIPADAPAVAGYVGGRFPTFATLVQRFPHAHRLSIAVASTQNAECVDREAGDVPTQLVPGWVKRQQARGIKRPVVYASVSEMAAVLRELAAAGIPRSAVRVWTAHYTFHEHRCTSACGFGFTGEADATQWTDRANGRSLDRSLCRPGFFG